MNKIGFAFRILLAVVSSLSLYLVIIVLACVYILPDWILSSLVSKEAAILVAVALSLLLVRQAYVVYREDQQLLANLQTASSLENQTDFLVFDASMKNLASIDPKIQQVALLQLKNLRSKGKFVKEIDILLVD